MATTEKLTQQDLALCYGCEAEVQGNHFEQNDPRDGTTLYYLNDGDLVKIDYEHLAIMEGERNLIFKPILRPLPDMTDGERAAVRMAEIPEAMLSDKYSEELVKLSIESASRTVYLLRQGLDVFGWIEAGLAIDKTKLE